MVMVHRVQKLGFRFVFLVFSHHSFTGDERNVEIRLNVNRAKDIFRPIVLVSLFSTCPMRRTTLVTADR